MLKIGHCFKMLVIVWTLALVVVACSASDTYELSTSLKLDPALVNPIDKLIHPARVSDGEKLTLVDFIFGDILPPLYGQRSNNENGTRSEFKDYALYDKSNDDATHLTGQELILRSGFKYEMYDAVADDGYITTVTRLINPLADRTKLRQPPILMEHGGTIDPTAYIVASSVQHFPEKWPRTPEDGPMKSWNRSLAFVLANNGFDVFLAETRGANDLNTRRIKSRPLVSTLMGKNQAKNLTLAENIRSILESWDYWSFSQDDIIAHELKSHMDCVSKVTGSSKMHLFTFSLSTPTSLAFLSTRPDYAQRVEGFVSMAPIVSGQGVSLLIKSTFETICPFLPNELGTLVITDILLTQPIRELVLLFSKWPEFRYIWVKNLITAFMGASPKYETLLEMNFIGHLMRRLSFRVLKQMCQQMRRNKLQKFDWGPVKNLLLYKQLNPPVYDLSKIGVKDWIIVSAANDALSTPDVVNHLIESANPKPIARFEAPGFNHADLFAGWDNDKYVNFPILRYYEQMSYGTSSAVKGKSTRSSSRGRGLDISSILPPEMLPSSLIETGFNATRKAGSIGPLLTLDSKTLIEEFGRNLRFLMTGVGKIIANGGGNKLNGNEVSGKSAATKDSGIISENSLPFQMPSGLNEIFQQGNKQINQIVNPSEMMQNVNKLGSVFNFAQLNKEPSYEARASKG